MDRRHAHADAQALAAVAQRHAPSDTRRRLRKRRRPGTGLDDERGEQRRREQDGLLGGKLVFQSAPMRRKTRLPPSADARVATRRTRPELRNADWWPVSGSKRWKLSRRGRRARRVRTSRAEERAPQSAPVPSINDPGLVTAASAPSALSSSPAIANDRAVLGTSARPGSRTSSRKMACEVPARTPSTGSAPRKGWSESAGVAHSPTFDMTRQPTRVHVGSSASARFARASSDAKNRVRPHERQTTTVNFGRRVPLAETRQVVRRVPAAGADFLASSTGRCSGSWGRVLVSRMTPGRLRTSGFGLRRFSLQTQRRHRTQHPWHTGSTPTP